MDTQMTDLERQIAQQRADAERASVKQEAADILARQEAKRQADTAEYVRLWRQQTQAIQAKLPAHEATIQAAYIELNTMVESGMVNFNRVRELANGIEASYTPIENLRQQAISNRQYWASQQPGFNPAAGLFALPAEYAVPFGNAPLPEAQNAHAALRAWVENNREHNRLRAAIVYGVTGRLYNFVDPNRAPPPDSFRLRR